MVVWNFMLLNWNEVEIRDAKIIIILLDVVKQHVRFSFFILKMSFVYTSGKDYPASVSDGSGSFRPSFFPFVQSRSK